MRRGKTKRTYEVAGNSGDYKNTIRRLKMPCKAPKNGAFFMKMAMTHADKYKTKRTR